MSNVSYPYLSRYPNWNALNMLLQPSSLWPLSMHIIAKILKFIGSEGNKLMAFSMDMRALS
jgi:hypothetical protein